MAVGACAGLVDGESSATLDEGGERLPTGRDECSERTPWPTRRRLGLAAVLPPGAAWPVERPATRPMLRRRRLLVDELLAHADDIALAGTAR